MPKRHAAQPALPLLTTLAALGLAAALPQAARAQSLTLGNGDAVTVSSAGTLGVIGGIPVANNTTTYTDASPSYYAARTQGNSALTLASGGALLAGPDDEGLYASGSGLITITGGAVTGGQDAILDLGTGAILISGGAFTSGQYGYGVDVGGGSGPVTISGGTFSGASGLYAGGQDQITVTGGLFTNTQGFYADTGGTISLFGSSFMVNGVPMNNTSLPSGHGISTVTGTLSGVLTNGQSFSTTFGNRGTINLNIAVAPEPSGVAALGLGLAGLGGLVLTARRRRVSAA